ncbi:hypothetical protein Tsubulata_012321, partial [Turnera subulata]
KFPIPNFFPFPFHNTTRTRLHEPTLPPTTSTSPASSFHSRSRLHPHPRRRRPRTPPLSPSSTGILCQQIVRLQGTLTSCNLVPLTSSLKIAWVFCKYPGQFWWLPGRAGQEWSS